MKTTYDYETFEISLIKQKNNIIIKCLDTTLFKVYEETYNDLYTNEMYQLNLENFL